METATRWYHYIAYFFGGVFCEDHPPSRERHLGFPFQSPFASPPGQGLSSSTVNVLWGMLNLAGGLWTRGPRRSIRPAANAACLRPGTRSASRCFELARHFGQFHGGLR